MQSYSISGFVSRTVGNFCITIANHQWYGINIEEPKKAWNGKLKNNEILR